MESLHRHRVASIGIASILFVSLAGQSAGAQDPSAAQPSSTGNGQALPLRGLQDDPVKPREVKLTPGGVRTEELPLKDITPGTVQPRDVQLGPGGVTSRPLAPAAATPQDIQAQQKLRGIADDATKSSGAIFEDPEKVIVKPPLLTALITLQKNRSPFMLDADSENAVSLRDVLTSAFQRNLTIKITAADSDIRKWNFFSSLGGFLPNLTQEIAFQGLNGNYVSPGGISIPIKNPFLTTNNAFTAYVFKGGGIVYEALRTRNQYKASQYALKGTINDVLTEATLLYYDLVKNEVLLQIRIKGVESAQALLLVNQDLFDNGVNTMLDVLRAKYRLSSERQKLIQQQVDRRESAVKLAAALNADTGIDLTARDRAVGKIRLVDNSLAVADLLKIAIDNRPELKRYEHLKQAAKQHITVVRSQLLPTVAATGAVIGTGSKIDPSFGQQTSQQQTPLSSAGVGVGSVSSAGSLPLVPGQGNESKVWSMRSLFNIGIDIQWNLGGLGLTEAAKVQSARAEARRYQLEFNRALEDVYKEVRDAYLSSIAAENLIYETTDAVNAAREGLRVAEIRLKDGVGTTLEVVEAQKDYITSLTDKAEAIVKFNVSQAKLLRAIGRVTVDTLTASVPLRK